MNCITSQKGLEPTVDKNAVLWLGIFGAAFLAAIFILAIVSKPDGPVELQTVPWQTLLFIDNTNKII